MIYYRGHMDHIIIFYTIYMLSADHSINVCFTTHIGHDDSRINLKVIKTGMIQKRRCWTAEDRGPPRPGPDLCLKK